MGQKPIPARNNGVAFDSTWQVAKVSKPLGAVIEMVKKGNRVTFDRDDKGNCTSEIFNKPTGHKIPIKEVGPTGAEHYEFDMWVKVGKKDFNAVNHISNKTANTVVSKTKFDAFRDDFCQSNIVQDFTRLV